jgi:hypothetical protein
MPSDERAERRGLLLLEVLQDLLLQRGLVAGVFPTFAGDDAGASVADASA